MQHESHKARKALRLGTKATLFLPFVQTPDVPIRQCTCPCSVRLVSNGRKRFHTATMAIEAYPGGRYVFLHEAQALKLSRWPIVWGSQVGK